jgi:endonuclease YncB( thermonuclease family)
VIVEPDFVDKRGTFFGTITLNNKNDLGLMLIEEGLAQVSVIGNRGPPNLIHLEDAERKAKADGIGIWAKNVKLNIEGSSKKITQNERT